MGDDDFKADDESGGIDFGDDESADEQFFGFWWLHRWLFEIKNFSHHFFLPTCRY